MSASAPAVASEVELEVIRIQKLLEAQRFAEAQESAADLIQRVPDNRDVLYMLAVSLRYLNRIPEALDNLENLEKSHPGFSRLYQERGHCYAALRDATRAIDAFLRGVNINPALPASWARLEALYRLIGDAEHAEMAAGHVATLKNLPTDVVAATALFSDGELTQAENLIRAFLLKHGSHIEAMRLLARIGKAREVYDDAEILLAAVLELAPDYHVARYEYAQVLLDRQKHLESRDQLDILLKQDPTNRQYQILHATACIGIGDLEKAIKSYRVLLKDADRPAELHLSVAHALKTMGRRTEAIESYRAAAQSRPNYGDAYWSLANLKVFRFDENDIALMLNEEVSTDTPLIDRYHLCFALGKALEDCGDYEASFRYYERGNSLKKSETKYRPEPVERNTRMQREICTSDFFSARKGHGASSADPIFIVGLPRSGSTLLEQILSSHSQVEGTAELPDIPRMVLEFQGRDPDFANPRYPGALAELTADDCRKLGEKYLADTLRHRTGKPYYIDKMPNNFRHVGLIHLMLPNAKIIDARREPMACCFSNLKQLFASGQEFTYGVEDIARYYRTYLELMRHWHGALPGRILTVMHEEVVDNLEGHVRRLLQFCGLEFEPACLNFHLTQRSVRTASSEQVRQPLFRDGLEQWKHFEPWLEPLKAALGDATHRYRELT